MMGIANPEKWAQVMADQEAEFRMRLGDPLYDFLEEQTAGQVTDYSWCEEKGGDVKVKPRIQEAKRLFEAYE